MTLSATAGIVRQQAKLPNAFAMKAPHLTVHGYDKMKLLFLHGYGSDPNGIRPTYLKESGYEVIHPALPDEDFPQSVRIAQQAYDEGQPDVVIGSSRGGAVAMNMDGGDTPLVLIAPAWKTRGVATTVKRETIILHSAQDDVVPIEHSRELIERSGLTQDRLVVVGQDHRMDDAAAFKAMLEAVEIFRKS